MEFVSAAYSDVQQGDPTDERRTAFFLSHRPERLHVSGPDGRNFSADRSGNDDKDKERLSIDRNTRNETSAYASWLVAEGRLLAGDSEGGIEHLRHSWVYRKSLRVMATLGSRYFHNGCNVRCKRYITACVDAVRATVAIFTSEGY